MEETDIDTIKWWDSVAEEQRHLMNFQMGDTRREGELLTTEYEKSRNGISPKWVSIETNLAGVDVLSHKNRCSKDSILIEAKASKATFQTATFLVTRHEWEIATLENNIERYYFYLWSICKKISSDCWCKRNRETHSIKEWQWSGNR